MLFNAHYAQNYPGIIGASLLDDIIPLMEVVEYYQINIAPVQQMCDEAVLTQMNELFYFATKVCQNDA